MKWRQPLGRRGLGYCWQTPRCCFPPRKLAGGGAKRNHRDKSKNFVRVPAGTPDRNSQQDQSRSGALSGRVVLSYRFRWLRFASPPANFHRASGAEGVCQQNPEIPHSKGYADLIYAHASALIGPKLIQKNENDQRHPYFETLTPQRVSKWLRSGRPLAHARRQGQFYLADLPAAPTLT